MYESTPSFFAFVLLFTIPPIAIGAELWRVARNRGRTWLWFLGALLYVGLVTLACQYYKVRWELYEAIGAWTSQGWRKYLAWFLLVEVASLAAIALILAWDWLIYRRLPWRRWRSERRRQAHSPDGDG